jgi:hypothetical protein
MIGPVKGRIFVAALAAIALLVGARTAWAAFVTEGSPYPTGDDPLLLYSADFNGDTRPDVVALNGSDSSASVYLRQAGGGFAQEGAAIPVGTAPSGGATGDFNGDGRTDLAVSSFGAGTVTVLLRQAGGGFAQGMGSPIATGFSLGAIAAGDFDGNGSIDLAATRYSNNQVSILSNVGTGFSPQLPPIATGATPRTIVAGDFNGDGRTDLATTNIGDNTVTVALGPGFTAEPNVSVGNNSNGLVAGDFNSDGHSDLALTNAGTGSVSVLLRRPTNDGFDAQAPIAVTATPVGIATADFDRDGHPDLAVGANGGAVDVLHGNASGGFTRDQPIALAGSPQAVVAADFDGDTRPDIAVTQHAIDTFSVLLNPAPAGPGPSPTPTALPPPVAGKTVNVAPDSGTVKIKRPGSRVFVALTAAAQIPVGTTVDTRQGRIEITAAQGKGKTATADFYDGIFKLSQTKGSKPVTTLSLTEQLSCPRSGASAAAKKKKTRKLWGDGSGSFRTRGQYSAATVRGTKWLVQDTCTSTLTRVSRGAVTVQDLVKHKTVIVRAGKRYTARAKRR